MLTQDELKALLDYDSETGVFTWKRIGKFHKQQGKEAGTLDIDGSIRIQLNGRRYLAHRLAWLYQYGCFPPNLLDHKDCVRSNNAINNLRKATYYENALNQAVRKNNKLGLRGVVQISNERFSTKATFQGKQTYLGTFNTPEEASLVYREFCSKNHGEFIHQSVALALTN